MANRFFRQLVQRGQTLDLCLLVASLAIFYQLFDHFALFLSFYTCNQYTNGLIVSVTQGLEQIDAHRTGQQFSLGRGCSPHAGTCPRVD
jgi:hypothetical protein